MTNNDFINHIFAQSIDRGLHPWVLGTRSGFNKGRAFGGDADFPGMDSYFSMSVYRDPEGKRGLANAEECSCFFLDDVGLGSGSKVGTRLEDLPVPTWVIETSAGNHQVGYLFSTPIAIPAAQQLFKALGKSTGATDTGGQNPTRWGRLPVGVNSKPERRGPDGQPFVTRLVTWNPDVSYSMEDLATRLGLDLEGPRAAERKRPMATGAERMFEPGTDEPPALAALKANGLWKREAKEGVHDITCPWVDDHTGAIDDGAAYFEPDDAHPIGGFKCHHSSCSGRNIRHLLGHLGIPDEAASGRPVVRLKPGELHRVTKYLERVLHEAGHFRSENSIVRILSGGRMLTPSIDQLGLAITQHTTLQRWDGRTESWRNVDCPPGVARAVFADPDRRHLRPLTAIARQPFMREDGTVASTPGYDPQSGIFGTFDPGLFFEIPDAPSRGEAEAALELLRELINEVPFRSPADESAALCGMLSGAIRPILPTAPGVLVSSHVWGSGKSYLSDILVAFTGDAEAASATFIPDDTEVRKEILSKLMTGPACIKFDEMKGDLGPVRTVLSMLTAERIEGRRLGASETISVGTRALVLFAGNNVRPVEDMTRRVVQIHLDPLEEVPSTRKYRRDSLGEMRANRGRYLAAALTLIRGFIAAGAPKAPRAPETVSSFGRWSDWCRQPLMWLGLPDPASSMFDNQEEDPVVDALGMFIAALERALKYKRRPFLVRSLVALAENNPEFTEALREVAGDRSGKIDRIRLGHFLKQNAGRRVDGRRIEAYRGSRRSSAQYVLVVAPWAPPLPDPDLDDLLDLSPLNTEAPKRKRRGLRTRPMPPEFMEAEGQA